MKRILFLLTICLGGLVNAQTSYILTSVKSQPEIVDQSDYEFVQRVITQKPIHIHPDSLSRAFTICWNGPETIYTIIGPDKKKVKSGKIVNSVYIKTKRWKPGLYVLMIDDYSDVMVLMRNKK